MRALIRILVAGLGIGLFAWGSIAVAADKPKKFVPNKPLATPAELGFIGTTREELRAEIKRVSLLPVQLPAWLGDRPDARTALENEVSRFLTAAGFEVLGSSEFQSEFDRLNREAGGIFDAGTGMIRADLARALHEQALRATVANQRVDGYVLISVVQEGATFSAKHAAWDSVRDPSNHSGLGTLPALSLLVRLANTQDEILFARRGGIQLTGYSVPARGSTIPLVPINDLLRDSMRIERAARMATLPLSHSARAIFNGFHNPDINAEKIPESKLPPQPAQYKEAFEPLKVPREQILAAVKHVAIVPLDIDGREIPEELESALAAMVRHELSPLGWEIVELAKARDALRTKMQELRPFDPFTGKLDAARKAEARTSVFRTLGAGRLDAILWVRVVRTTAIQRYGTGEWDGVKQAVLLSGPVSLYANSVQGEFPDAGIRALPASSVQLSITDGNDAVLYESRGGLQLMQALKVTPGLGSNPARIETTDLHPNGLIGFEQRQVEAVHAALRDLTMTPEALAAELDPDPKQKKKKT